MRYFFSLTSSYREYYYLSLCQPAPTASRSSPLLAASREKVAARSCIYCYVTGSWYINSAPPRIQSYPSRATTRQPSPPPVPYCCFPLHPLQGMVIIAVAVCCLVHVLFITFCPFFANICFFIYIKVVGWMITG